jgi:hypothetical protein
MTATDLFVWGLVAHLIADWLLQNEWIAVHKVRLLHPASSIHATIHLICLLVPFSRHWIAAVFIALAHQWVDTRVPLTWWRRVFRQTTEGPMAPHVAIWGDQVLHVGCLAVAALICGRR